MNTKLDYIKDWLLLAKKVNWSAAIMAEECGVCERTLRRYFLKEMGNIPRIWLAEQRQRQAIELLSEGMSIKETACILGYKQPANFARRYKAFWGTCPSVKQPPPNIVRTSLE